MLKIKAKPFLKWAGGKSQLLCQFEKYYPGDLSGGIIENYIEPFVGGGAVFFEVIQKYNIQSSYIYDINKDLILTYQVIQKTPDLLLEILQRYQSDYNHADEQGRKNLFLSVRKQFNVERLEINHTIFSENWMPRAAQFIFLNKTCFNGLFRLNSKGEFNVPFGGYKKPNIWDENNILAVSELLQNTIIELSTYENCFDLADEKTFVYFDPPYRPISKTASFTTYTGFEFTDVEQIKLSHFFKKLDTQKCSKLMLSNSDPKNENPNDDFFEKIYNGYELHRVYARRMINCNAEKRGKINELLVTNYGLPT
ncbi:MAG: DNA adenine methylase [Candidatus Competibacteraceae bacterium]|uniref:Site-specific DNA-methyltransferase (adenine-specific) n=1 Tax=Candidatus Contendobacter odensis Run_B_J11 TaxID=1400861 RepID=A0A7U7GDK0_9GAMM|nr:DNA adenine methylase [Candidatus Contendobacter odensis]MBK8535320.1 DNA adenine methylase [Candidatus Competibacteraceae bacterium]MBK8753881.1 DNA adenine methylase [Candidatus Competibacteraceae bacterium]CDH46436.1 DNA adenine methylase (Dam) [Candidatus Contendobacter odensis Run_B_J11]